MALVKHNNNSLTNLTALPSAVPTGKMTLLNTATASSSANITFNNTYINGDYLIYKFDFISIHAATENAHFSFNVSIDNGSNFNVAKTTTFFRAGHAENGAESYLNYRADGDLAQGTGDQRISEFSNIDNDSSTSGSMLLFNPNSSVFVKHFIADTSLVYNATPNYNEHNFTAGYANTTSDVDAIIFKMSSGNIDAGQIKLYGLGS